MGNIRDAANATYADGTPGVPLQPDKNAIRNLFGTVEDAVRDAAAGAVNEERFEEIEENVSNLQSDTRIGGYFRSTADPAELMAGVMLPYVVSSVNGASILTAGNVLWLIPVWGQSLANGDSSPAGVPGNAIATTPLYFGRALMPSTGVRVSNGPHPYTLVDAVETTTTPSYGNATETIVTSMLTSLVAQSDAVTGSNSPRFAGLVSAQGGMPYKSLKRGTQVWQTMLKAIADVVAIAKASGMQVIVPVIGSIHGENHTNGVDVSTRAQYFGMLRQLARDFGDDVLQITGQNQRPILFLSQTGTITTGGGLDQQVQLAQLDAGKTDWARLVGPNYFLPRTDTNNIHLTSVSENRLGQIFGEAIFAEINAQGWKPLSPIKVSVTSPTTIQVDCHVPVAPLVLDTTGAVNPAGLQGNSGFDVQLPSGSYATISNVAISGTSVILTLSAPLSAPWIRVGYAMRRNSDAGNDDGPVLGARGCIRDSAAIASPWEATFINNWMVMWSEVVEVHPLDGAWTSYVPTLAWTGGTPTAATISAYYKRVGKTLFLRAALYTGSALNGATAVTISLPAGMTSISGQSQAIYGLDAGTAGVIYLRAASAATVMSVYPGSGGLVVDRYLQSNGVIEVQ